MRESTTLDGWRARVKKIQGLLSSGFNHLVLQALLESKEYLGEGGLNALLLNYEKDIYPILETAQKLDEIAHEKEFRIFLSGFILMPLQEFLKVNPECYQKSRRYILKHLNNAEEGEIKHPALFPYVAENFYEYVHAVSANPHEQLKKLRERYVKYLQQNPEVYDICAFLHIILSYWRVLKSSGLSAEIYRESKIDFLILLMENILLNLRRDVRDPAEQELKRVVLLFYILLHEHSKIKAWDWSQCLWPLDGFVYSLRSGSDEIEKASPFNIDDYVWGESDLKIRKDKLDGSRNVFIDQSKDIFEAQKAHTQDIIVLIKEMFLEAVVMLGEPPCDIEICVLGSTARNDRRPYSDIELMILHDDSPEKLNSEERSHWQAHVDVYIYHLVILFELKMIVLGETPKPGEKNGGFRIDTSTHVLLKKVWGTPIDLAQRFVSQLEADGKGFKHAWLNPEFRAMLHPLKIHSNHFNSISLTEKYKKIISGYLNDKIENEDNIPILVNELNLTDGTCFQGLSRQQGIGVVLSYETFIKSKHKIENLPLNSWVNIKEVYYKPLAYFAKSLLLFYEKELQSRDSEIDETYYAIFQRMKSHCSMGAQVMLTLLQSALGFIVRQQVVLHNNAHHQEEEMRYRFAQADSLFWEGADLIAQGLILPLHVALEAWTKDPVGEFSSVLDRLSEKSWNREFIQRWYAVCERSGFSTEAIYVLPDPAGFRVKERILEQKLEERIQALMQRDWSSPLPNWPMVRIKRVTKEGEFRFDLDQKVIEAIIDPKTGHIKSHEKIEISPNAFKDRAVNYVEKVGLHFKEHPDRPPMAYFSHLLHMRIFGSGSIPAEVVLFEVTLQNKTKLYYPVLISLTVPGPTLESRLNNLSELNLPRLAANLVMDAVKHTADSFGRNFIIYNDSECVCVDSEQIFVNSESEASFWKSSKIQELSIFYCLPIFREGGKLFDTLPPETINALTNLDVDLVLNECLDLLSQREKLDLQVYGEHLPTFVRRSKEHPFVGDVLFDEGMIGKLALELRTLKGMAKRGRLSPFEVLSVCFGPTCAKQYLMPTTLSPSEHLKQVVGRVHSQSPGQFEKQCLGSGGSFEKLRLRQYSIEKAKEEIANYQFLTIKEEADLKSEEFSTYSEELTLVINFSGNEELDKRRLTQLIMGKKSFVQLIIKNCSVLEDSNLRALLRNSGDSLKLLSISGHPKITESTFDFLMGFPKLEVLIANQTGVKNLARMAGLRSMQLDNLKVLRLNSCSQLISVDLTASQLLYFCCKNNEKLTEFKLRTPRLTELKLDEDYRLEEGELSVSWRCVIKTQGVFNDCVFNIEYGSDPSSFDRPRQVKVLVGNKAEIARLTGPASLIYKLHWPANLDKLIRKDLEKVEAMLVSKKDQYENATVERQELFLKKLMLLCKDICSNRSSFLDIFSDRTLNTRNIMALPELACIYPTSGLPIPRGLIKVLINALKNRDSAYKIHAISILGKLRQLPTEAITALIEILKDEDSKVVAEAISALGNLQQMTPAVVDVLIEQLKAKNWRVRAKAASSLTNLKPFSLALINALIEVLQNDSDAEVRTQAMTSLKNVNPINNEMIDPLIKALEDSDPDVRALAALALGNSHQPFTKPVILALHKALDDGHWTTRANAATALGNTSAVGERAVGVVINALKEKLEDINYTVTVAARSSIHKLEKIKRQLNPSLQSSTAQKCRDWLVNKLSNLEKSPPVLVASMIEQLKILERSGRGDLLLDKEPENLIGVIQELEENYSLAIQYISEQENLNEMTLRQNNISLSEKLVSLVGGTISELSSQLVEALGDWDLVVRTQAASALLQLCKENPEPINVVLTSIIMKLGNWNENVRNQSMSILLELGKECSRVILLLRHSLRDTKLDHTIRANVAYLLGALGQGNPEILTELIKAMLAADDWERDLIRKLVSAIGELGKGSPEATQALIKMLGDRYFSVRTEVALGLCDIAENINIQSDRLIAEFAALEILKPRRLSDLIVGEGSPVFSGRSRSEAFPESIELSEKHAKLFRDF